MGTFEVKVALGGDRVTTVRFRYPATPEAWQVWVATLQGMELEQAYADAKRMYLHHKACAIRVENDKIVR